VFKNSLGHLTKVFDYKDLERIQNESDQFRPEQTLKPQKTDDLVDVDGDLSNRPL
jgi:hypothetical protein